MFTKVMHFRTGRNIREVESIPEIIINGHLALQELGLIQNKETKIIEIYG